MILFLIILALIWLIIASYTDLKKREVPNWLSFSLIIFALAYRAFYSVLSWNLWFFVYGLLGFLVFVGLAYGFYYARIFAGGDAKLLMGLGTILPSTSNFYSNLSLLFSFIFLLLFVGGFYGLIYSLFLIVREKEKFVKEFLKQAKQNQSLFFISLLFMFLSLSLAIYSKERMLFVLPLLFLLFPILFSYGKAVEETCMIKEIAGKEITIGDWLYQEVRVGNKIIKPYWQGLNEEEVKLLRNKKKIKIKEGIPFVPCFFISFVLLLLWHSFWSFFGLFWLF